MNQISVARALVTCNRLVSDINEKIKDSVLAYVTKNSVSVKDGKSKVELLERSKADVQSIEDKINTMFTLRSGINKINAETMVTIGKDSMSILDALSYRIYVLPRLIEFRDELQRQRRLYVTQYQNEVTKKENLIAESVKNDTDTTQRGILEESIKIEYFGNDELLERLNARISFFEVEFDVIMTELNPGLKF